MMIIMNKFIAVVFLTCLCLANGQTIFNRQKEDTWFKSANDVFEENVRLQEVNKKAKGVIVFVGDGMGVSTTTAARILDGQLKGMKGEENILSWENYKNVALSKTYSNDLTTTDSAASGTAIMTGVKTNGGLISMDSNAAFQNCALETDKEVLSIIMLAEQQGLSTGVVTTTRITHATPSSAYAHSTSRSFEYTSPPGCRKDIASQLIDFPYGDGLEVALGGGQAVFFPNTSGGLRVDGRNLIEEWKNQSSNHTYITTKSQLAALDPRSHEKVIGLFAPNHLDYSYNRQNSTTQPSFVDMIDFAIKKLQKNPKGYVLLAEAGRIDHGHHANLPHHALRETIELSEAVERANSLTNPNETLTIVTADHSHVFTIGGYQGRGTPIFDFTNVILTEGLDGQKMTTLGYYNGPGAAINNSRTAPTREQTQDPNIPWKSTLVPLVEETHSAEDVGIYARGCQAHLIRGVVECNYIFQVMDYALCLTPDMRTLCERQGLISNGTKDDDNGTKDDAAGLSINKTLFVLITVIMVSLTVNG